MIHLQGEYHLPGHNFTGPGTKLKYRLERGDQPVNKVDALALSHDMRYDNYDSAYERFNADVHFIVGSAGIVFSPSSTWRERGEALLVGGVMTIKILSNFVNPLKKFSQLKQFGKRAKDFKPIRQVM